MCIERNLFQRNYSKILKILKIANETPYYNGVFNEIALNVHGATYEEFSRIPIMDKASYRTHCFDMISSSEIKNFDKAQYENIRNNTEKRKYLEQFGIKLRITSGSTGQPLEVLKSENDYNRDYFNLNLYRRKVTPYDFSGKYMWVWPTNPIMLEYIGLKIESEYRVKDKFGFLYYLHEFSEKSMFDLYNALIKERCEWITASPTVMTKLGQYIKVHKLTPPKLLYIECHSEKLYEWQREIIEDVFGLLPVSIYSSNEVQFIGAECQCGYLHTFNSVFVEFINHSNRANEIVVSSLINFDIPILRYKLGDCGDWANEKCSHNRYPAFKIEGHRTNDLLKTISGNLIEPFVISDAIYLLSKESEKSIAQYQVKQRSMNEFNFYFNDIDFNNLSRNAKMFLENYLSKLLGYETTVEILCLSQLDSIVKKHKYFEVVF